MYLLLPETSNVVITNQNADREPLFEALSKRQNELMGVLCEKGKNIQAV